MFIPQSFSFIISGWFCQLQDARRARQLVGGSPRTVQAPTGTESLGHFLKVEIVSLKNKTSIWVARVTV